jgi:hypothetical protein
LSCGVELTSPLHAVGAPEVPICIEENEEHEGCGTYRR